MNANDYQVGGDHYKSEIQHWDIVERFGVGFCEGCASKYVMRARSKNGLQDLNKARHYVVKLLELNAGPPEEWQRMFIEPGGILIWQWKRENRGQVPAWILNDYQKANRLTEDEMRIIILIWNWRSDLHLQQALQMIEVMIGAAQHEE